MSTKKNLKFETFLPNKKFKNIKTFDQNKLKVLIKKIKENIQIKNNMFNSFSKDFKLNFSPLELKNYKTSILDNHQSVPFWTKVNNLELFTSTKNNLIRAVIPPSTSETLMNFLSNKFKYFVDWSGSLFWIEVADKEDNKIGQIREFIANNEGYMTIIMKSENFDYKEKLFSTDEAKLMISKKIKESFDPKSLFNPGRMYREI